MICPHEIILQLHNNDGAFGGMVCTACGETWLLDEIRRMLRERPTLPAVRAANRVAEHERALAQPQETKA